MIINIRIDWKSLYDDDGIDEVELHRMLTCIPPLLSKQLDERASWKDTQTSSDLTDIDGNIIGTVELHDDVLAKELENKYWCGSGCGGCGEDCGSDRCPITKEVRGE